MKREIIEYVSRCLTCQQVKVEHQRPVGLLQPLQILEWKWEHVAMDFIVGLPATQKGHNGVWVVMDRWTKIAHFLPFNTKWSITKLVRYYVREIIRLHDVSVSIVSDRDARFTSRFWQSFQEAMGIKLQMSSAYHPQMDGQSERTIQILEDMLRACFMDWGGSWE